MAPLDATFNELDAIIERRTISKAEVRARPDAPSRAAKARSAAAAAAPLTEKAVQRATMFRAGSIARRKWQTDFYYRLGTSPWVRNVCEVGALSPSPPSAALPNAARRPE